MNLILKKIRSKVLEGKNDFLLKLKKPVYPNPVGGLILLYHGIDQVGNTQLNSKFISQAYFEQQIKYFKEHFEIIPLSQYFSGYRAKDKMTISLTFDDGYLNNIKYALPILEYYQVPASFFITAIQETKYDILYPDFLDLVTYTYHAPVHIDSIAYQKNRKGVYYNNQTKVSLKQLCKDSDFTFKEKMFQAFPKEAHSFKINAQYNDYWQLMDAKDIRAIAKNPLFEVGSHAYYHNSLASISKEKAQEELVESKHYLEALIQQEVKSLAYPNGSYSPSIREYAKSIGYDFQLAMDYWYPEDEKLDYIENRFGMNPYMSWHNQLICLTNRQYY